MCDYTYSLVKGPWDSEKLRRELTELTRSGEPLGVDTETTGLSCVDDRVRLLQVGSADRALLVDLDGWRAPSEDEEGLLERAVPWELPGLLELRAWLEDGTRSKILQYAVFDFTMLQMEGVYLRGGLFDTYIASQVVTNGMKSANSLDVICAKHLKVKLPKELQVADWGGDLTEDMCLYAARDVCVLPRLVPPMLQALRSSRVTRSITLYDVFKLEIKVMRPIGMMHCHGFGFSMEDAIKLRKDIEQEEQDKLRVLLDMLDTAIRAKHPNDSSLYLPRDGDGVLNLRKKSSGRGAKKLLAGFNPGSNPQMTKAFMDAGIILPPHPKTKGKFSLDQNLLAFLRGTYPLVNAYLEWKNTSTALSSVQTLIKSVSHDGRIHCFYKALGTETGRLSAASPNLQQVKREKRFRRLFQAKPGYCLVGGDFSQIELRVAAELSGEERMIAAYVAGRDLHTETAMLILNKEASEVTKSERRSAKTANFSLLYGGGAATLQKRAVVEYGSDMTIKEARQLVDGFRKAYPQLYAWQCEEGNKTTKAVYTKYGRRRLMVGFNDKYTKRINSQVQGTAGDIAKIAIAKIYKEIQGRARGEAALISMVHDELILEVREDLAEYWSARLRACMESAGALVMRRVPVLAEVSSGPTWGDTK